MHFCLERLPLPQNIRVDTGMKKMLINEAAREIGVAPVTLKRWFLDGKIPEVTKDRNGWRTFSQGDIERIRAYANSAQSEHSNSGRFKVASFFAGIGGFFF